MPWPRPLVGPRPLALPHSTIGSTNGSSSGSTRGGEKGEGVVAKVDDGDERGGALGAAETKGTRVHRREGPTIQRKEGRGVGGG
mmetsp:Transcript_17718/g.40685  ORF Transcript_17718/g.40685 Transcript_17718/m.40685 type:complete len:84 (-) Transcript_17718:110-361(-)